MSRIRLHRHLLAAVVGFLVPVLVAAQQPPAAPQLPAPQQDPVAKLDEQPVAKPLPGKFLVPAGTRLPLVLHNGITTRNAKPGDPVYFETLFPIIRDGHIVIPAGSYVQGEITDAKRPGKVKGRGELMVRLNTLILPNGYVVSFTAVPSNASTGGNESVQEEGRIKGDTDKASDAGTVIKTTALGTGIGAVVGRSAKGAGIGAGIGAAAGLATILMTRGPELELPRGTTVDVTLDRPLYLDADKAQFTDPGRASALAGPPNRQPQRNKIPF